MRIFVSIPVREPVADRLGSLVEGLGFGRPVPPHNMHVTLAFFADLNAREVEPLAEALSQLQVWAFDVTLAGLDLMGRRKPALLVASVVESPALTDLHARVQGATRAAGLEPQRRRFRPHVTLLRFAAGIGAGEQARLQGVIAGQAGLRESFEADHLVLNRSHLGSSPPVYEMLSETAFIMPPDGADDW
ncbi:RNA 2',3'-cyclic phosphodiesterase [Primorskyibacter aestuariivivens]|uniref:RNA 2',3'-cyclic phosphodiesterase n=1 Tax=Primorskyibacter aestuariivivens TaxID=1888912 RepID=UPI0023002B4E|nr:RNA 2',3'-cyclic phosphodiesterase [Primorskyibacter aestuariivivens]MDA7430757.1 RNA 2',3'-cyclic phosphodiesterase [Primorskyibacter aestuariivivens]